MHVVRLLWPGHDDEDHTKDIDFSPSGIRRRWDAGYEKTMRAIDGARRERRNLAGDQSVRSTIEAILPSADMMTQTILAHVELPNADGAWRPGQAVEGAAVVASTDAPLAVRTRALQRFRDFTVVFARVGETYEVRMLELGRQTPEWTEVLGGLAPGTEYVSDNAFVIRADVEKSGASHDH